MSKKKDTVMEQWLNWVNDANRRFYNRDVMSLAAKRMELDQREAKISNREQLLELRKKDLDHRIATAEKPDPRLPKYGPLWQIDYINLDGGQNPAQVGVGEKFDYKIKTTVLGQTIRTVAITLQRVR